MPAPKVEILSFSDPFCSWCWAMEPVLYRLKEKYRDQLRLRPVMGGLVPDMSQFLDARNGISSTADVAPHWEQVAEHTGQPIDGSFMRSNTDPHWGSWPACIAVKAASLQGDALGETYLRRMRRAVQAEGRNGSDPVVYEAIAEEIPGLDLARFRKSLADGSAERAFQADLAVCGQVGVRSFPTFLFVRSDSPESRPILLGGARDLGTFEEVLRRLAPELVAHEARPLPELLADYGPLTTRELAEILDQPMEALQATLSGAEGIRRVPLRKGELWELGTAEGPVDVKTPLMPIVAWDEGGMACDMETGICGPVTPPAR